MTLTRTVNVADEALPIIAAMEWEDNGAGVVGRLTCGQLERSLYLAVNKGLEALGGKWNRRHGGHVFAADPRPRIHSLLNTGKVEIIKDGYFPTPMEIGRRMAAMACVRPGMRVLEPSAGTGELAEAIRVTEPACHLWVAEKNKQRQQTLRKKGFVLLTCGAYDFLTYPVGRWPRIIQNPPFEGDQDVAHVQRAFECLEPGGVLVSVMSEGPFFRNFGRDVNFRQWLYGLEHYIVELEPGAFKGSGSNVKARIIRIHKDVQELQGQLPLFRLEAVR